MSYWLLAASGLSAAASTFTSSMDRQRERSIRATQYKIARKAREANNKLLAISSAQSRSVLEENRALARQDTVLQSERIQRDEIRSLGAVRAAAAASGAGGSVVASRLREVSAAAGRAQTERLRAYNREQRSISAQTTDLLFSTALGKDRTVTVKQGSIGTTLDAAISGGIAGITSAYTTFLEGERLTRIGS